MTDNPVAREFIAFIQGAGNALDLILFEQRSVSLKLISFHQLVSSKMQISDHGQVTIPRELLDQLGLGPGVGVEVEFKIHDGGLLLKIPKEPVPDAFDRWLTTFQGSANCRLGSNSWKARGPSFRKP